MQQPEPAHDAATATDASAPLAGTPPAQSAAPQPAPATVPFRGTVSTEAPAPIAAPAPNSAPAPIAAPHPAPAPRPTPATTDRRILRTRAALRLALAQEVEEVGDLSRVTVTAVTRRAGLTRRTFYSHFRDIPDLVERIEDEAIHELRPALELLASSNLDELRRAIDHGEPAPGAVELLSAVHDRGEWLRPLLGDGGDPAFAKRIKATAHDVIAPYARQGLELGILGPIFEYYLTFAISAEVGVLLRWLDGGMVEPVGTMARLMTGLMFVRPGDLYGNPIELDVPRFALAALCTREDS